MVPSATMNLASWISDWGEPSWRSHCWLHDANAGDSKTHTREGAATEAPCIRPAPVCWCVCVCDNVSMAGLGPTASPTTVPLFVLEHHPCRPREVAFSAVCLRKNTRCTLPVVAATAAAAQMTHVSFSHSVHVANRYQQLCFLCPNRTPQS